MTTFATPEPIAVRVDVVAGSVRLVATEREDTVVTVRAHDESRGADVRPPTRPGWITRTAS